MTQPNWEDVDVPRGAFIGWGMREGQHVTGKVVEYDPTGGNDFDQKPCPALAVELTERAASFNKAMEQTNHEPGTLVQLNAGQVSLKRAVRAADPAPGDLVKITLSNILKGQGRNGGDIKEFDIKIARGWAANNEGFAGSQPAPSSSTVGFGGGDEPPF